MAYSIKYTKGQYQAKIEELEGYYSMLSTHLDRMEELKKQMFSFWDDENARTTGELLAIKIRAVKDAMDLTNKTLIMHKSVVEKMDGANIEVSSLLKDALGILTGLGI